MAQDERSRPSGPGRLVLAFVVVESLHQTTQHLGRSLEQGLELRIVDLGDVVAQMVDGLLQLAFHLLDVMARIAVGGRHGVLLHLGNFRH
jgi:hypothetical protein